MKEAEWDTLQDDNLRGINSEDEEPMILEEIEIEDFFIDGICGVY